MSVWTHVCGLIYVDHMNFSNDLEKRDLFGAELESIFEIDAPEGSEGGLFIESVKGDGSGSSNIGPNYEFVDVSYRWGLSIFGDLRDYDKKDDVKKWIINSIKQVKNGLVRQGIVLIEVEGQPQLIWTFEKEK